MQIIVKTVVSILIPLLMQFSIINMVETTPRDAVTDFMNGLRTGDSSLTERYMDNEYVNLLVNVKGREKTVKRMYEALFSNFSFSIDKIATKNDVAVAKLTITANDFSGVMKSYDKASYKYVVKNLYREKMSDKEWLNERCFEIYVKQIEKAAKGEPSETVVYVPLIDNGYYGWNVLLTDAMMRSILGGLKIPEY